MEPIAGSDLHRYTTPSRLLPEPVVLKVGERVARALAHAHRAGVVLRDVKPSNILVVWGADQVKLSDFGLARLADAERTRTGLVLGSPAKIVRTLNDKERGDLMHWAEKYVHNSGYCIGNGIGVGSAF